MSSGRLEDRVPAWRRYARVVLGKWGELGRPHSYFDRLSLLSAPADAFRSRAVKWEVWRAGLCPACPPDCLPCCSLWGARFLCSCSCLSLLLFSADSCSRSCSFCCLCGGTSTGWPWSEMFPPLSGLRSPARLGSGEGSERLAAGLCAPPSSPPRCCLNGSPPGAPCSTMVSDFGASCLSSPLFLRWSETVDGSIVLSALFSSIAFSSSSLSLKT